MHSAFIEEMKRNFDHPVQGRNVSIRLLNIKQEQRSVAEYALEFRTLAAEAGWNEVALRGSFYHGLSDQLKDELSLREEPATLDQWIASALKLDNRLRERRRERRSRPVTTSTP